MKKIIILTALFCPSLLLASELVYTPINPSFGGSPLNASMLLNKAQSQNKHKAHTVEKTYAERLQESLERSYINKIVRELTDLAFGEDPTDNVFGQDSTFVSGDYEIKMITSNSDSITVQITNLINGEITTIEVPRFTP
ncbi:curli production assembly protein CsgF [Pseudoalteromonas citrea]|uniref:Curli production assembly/transport component CsgF n=1 Tax=Pseudoalteromonas citrea TaxID=43655 RepID=A0A5S3XS87_9GAMM|nr:MULTISPECIES: curli assembly protein CsgF [Pseudoalteromonas]RJE78319.1 curli production assembly protein CsgF [Pseudoalteromonas sp. MSK9-3]TMP46807.1 curli production assembly protein CsgF [Pseudoalteromonas citrea]TMP60319.1 curli production assembly protein CsgF [Pseudoalteromonas citrea]